MCLDGSTKPGGTFESGPELWLISQTRLPHSDHGGVSVTSSNKICGFMSPWLPQWFLMRSVFKKKSGMGVCVPAAMYFTIKERTF